MMAPKAGDSDPRGCLGRRRRAIAVTVVFAPADLYFSVYPLGGAGQLGCDFQRGSWNLPAVRETWVRSLGWEDPLEKGKAAHHSILTWRIPWTV